MQRATRACEPARASIELQQAFAHFNLHGGRRLEYVNLREPPLSCSKHRRRPSKQRLLNTLRQLVPCEWLETAELAQPSGASERPQLATMACAFLGFEVTRWCVKSVRAQSCSGRR
ncbi:unnamed protein product [Polarella glacialis]|uniref:Uncharacterized protein n=1 Tax=Polarella glacialis TaxID=89957 RepID=A0A813G1N4_POLGL|nr:unnamed protein product [Polarella glacialis]